MEVRFLSGAPKSPPLIMKSSSLTDFIFEAAALKRLKRTGWQILGENKESIAEHSFMVTVISFILARQEKVNLEKVLLMSLFHDFEEARTGDVYKLADFYTKTDKNKAIKDAFSRLKNPSDIIDLLKEYSQKQSLASKIVRDADTLSLCFELKILMEKGNKNAGEWFFANLKTLRTKTGKAISRQLKTSSSQNWWKKERRALHRLMSKK